MPNMNINVTASFTSMASPPSGFADANPFMAGVCQPSLSAFSYCIHIIPYDTINENTFSYFKVAKPLSIGNLAQQIYKQLLIVRGNAAQILLQKPFADLHAAFAFEASLLRYQYPHDPAVLLVPLSCD